MLSFILALFAMIVAWLVGEPPSDAEVRRQAAAWTEAPMTRQTMTTNIRIVLAGDTYLFFPSDDLYFRETYPAKEAKPRVTLNLAKQSSALMYLPQQRAVREQRTRHGNKAEQLCARSPQDFNAAIKWEAKQAPDPGDAKPGGKPSAVRIAYPAYELFLMQTAAVSKLDKADQRDAAWKRLMNKLNKHAGTPVELTEELSLKAAEGRVFAKILPSGGIVSLWRVTPITHAVYRYRIELVQDTISAGGVINTAIFASTDAIVPCLDLSERISAHAISLLNEASTRTRLD